MGLLLSLPDERPGQLAGRPGAEREHVQRAVIAVEPGTLEGDRLLQAGNRAAHHEAEPLDGIEREDGALSPIHHDGEPPSGAMRRYDPGDHGHRSSAPVVKRIQCGGLVLQRSEVGWAASAEFDSRLEERLTGPSERLAGSPAPFGRWLRPPTEDREVGDSPFTPITSETGRKEEGRGAFPVTAGIPGPIALRVRLPGLDLPVHPPSAGPLNLAFAVPPTSGPASPGFRAIPPRPRRFPAGPR